jgi:YD repeat-containing protein
MKKYCSLLIVLMLLCAGCAGVFKATLPGGVVLDFTCDGEGNLTGTTNLPDGSVIYLQISQPNDAQNRAVEPTPMFVTVKDGGFTVVLPESRSPQGARVYGIDWSLVTSAGKAYVVKE